MVVGFWCLNSFTTVWLRNYLKLVFLGREPHSTSLHLRGLLLKIEHIAGYVFAWTGPPDQKCVVILAMTIRPLILQISSNSTYEGYLVTTITTRPWPS
jgi:hypothetical protein